MLNCNFPVIVTEDLDYFWCEPTYLFLGSDVPPYNIVHLSCGSIQLYRRLHWESCHDPNRVNSIVMWFPLFSPKDSYIHSCAGAEQPLPKWITDKRAAIEALLRDQLPKIMSCIENLDFETLIKLKGFVASNSLVLARVNNIPVGARVVTQVHGDIFNSDMHRLAGKEILAEIFTQGEWYHGFGYSWHESWLSISKKDIWYA